MNPLTAIREYLEGIERRLRALALSRGAALTGMAALAFTILGVVLANYFAFSAGSIVWARLLLFLALAAALGAGLIMPVLKLNRRGAAREAEQRCPEFEQRLLTFAERTQNPDPFLELLAADTLDVAREAHPERIAPQNRILGFASAAALSIAALLWLGMSGPGFLGYGTSLLWAGIPKGEQQAFYDITVEPGNRTLRKGADQLITARLTGFQAQPVKIFAKYKSASKWEEAVMRTRPPALRGRSVCVSTAASAMDSSWRIIGWRSGGKESATREIVDATSVV